MKLDIKSVAIGVLSSLLLVSAFGYTRVTGEDQFISGYINWAMAVPSDGKVLARAYDGTAFVIDVASSKAKKVEYDPKKTSVMNDILILSSRD